MKTHSSAPVIRVTAIAALGAVAVVVAAVVAALSLVGCGGSGSSGSPAPTGSASTTASTTGPTTAASSASPSGSAGSLAKQLVIAAASGPRENGLSVISSKGQVKQLMAPHGGPIHDIAWSPDGNRLAFLQSKKGASYYAARLRWYDATTGKSSQIVFSAEGREVSVDSFAWIAPTELIASVVAGRSTMHNDLSRNGTFWLCDVVNGSRNTMHDSGGHALRGASLSSSAGGAKVAYVFYGARSQIDDQMVQVAKSVRVLHVDNRNVTTVVKASYCAEQDPFYFPLISPDGSLIYTLQTGSDISFGYTVYRLDGSKALHHRHTYVWVAPGAWSSGGRLAFGGAPASHGLADSIQVWQPRDAKPTAILAPTQNIISSLAWSPKATQIAYAAVRPNVANGYESVWVVNADGSNKHLLLAKAGCPAWAIAPISFP